MANITNIEDLSNVLDSVLARITAADRELYNVLHTDFDDDVSIDVIERVENAQNVVKSAVSVLRRLRYDINTSVSNPVKL